MKKSLILTSLLVGVFAFSGCGSDSDSSSGDAGTRGSTGNTGNSGINTSSLTPVTTKVVCDPKAITSSEGIYDLKYAADGDITVMCKTAGQYTYGEYQLVTGVNTLTITDMKKVEEFSVSAEKAKGKGVDTYNYKSGTIHRQVNAVVDGKTEKYDCTETYPSPLPTTLTDTTSIEDLFQWDGDENHRITTTCPASYYAEDGSGDDSLTKGTASVITNYTLTDGDGKKHLVTESTEITFK
jgi:hypothetical protein